jgi:hypothetical protein
MRFSLGTLAVLAGSARLARLVPRGTRLIVFVGRMALEWGTIDIAFLLITGRETGPGKALARRFAARFAVSNGLVLARRLAGFRTLRHT